MCPVCIEAVSGESSHALDGCGHVFHSRCIIRWMREGNLTCPTCRLNLHTDTRVNTQRPLYTTARASYLRTLARRPSAPADLKRLVRGLRCAEERVKEERRCLQEFKQEHKEVIRRHRIHEGRYWRSRRRVCELQLLLSNYHSYDVPLPPLAVLTR